MRRRVKADRGETETPVLSLVRQAGFADDQVGLRHALDALNVRLAPSTISRYLSGQAPAVEVVSFLWGLSTLSKVPFATVVEQIYGLSATAGAAHEAEKRAEAGPREKGISVPFKTLMDNAVMWGICLKVSRLTAEQAEMLEPQFDVWFNALRGTTKEPRAEGE